MYAEFFGKRLAKARKDAGYTQMQISKQLGFPQGTISNWERGYTQPDIESIGILADFYNVSIDWLFSMGAKNASQKTSA